MKKILLTENQSKILVDKIISEQVPVMRATEYSLNDGRYHMKCQFNFSFNYDYTTYKSGKIDDFEYGYADVSFLIDIDHQPYGINGIRISDIKIPKAIKTKIRYYPPGSSSDDEDWLGKRIEEEIIIPLDSKKIKTDDMGQYHKMQYFGIWKKISVDVVPDGKGGLIGTEIEITKNEYISKRED